MTCFKCLFALSALLVSLNFPWIYSHSMSREVAKEPQEMHDNFNWCSLNIKHTSHRARCSCNNIEGLVPRVKMLLKISSIESRGKECCKNKEGKCDCLTPIYKELNDIAETCSIQKNVH